MDPLITVLTIFVQYKNRNDDESTKPPGPDLDRRTLGDPIRTNRESIVPESLQTPVSNSEDKNLATIRCQDLMRKPVRDQIEVSDLILVRKSPKISALRNDGVTNLTVRTPPLHWILRQGDFFIFEN
ncbi:MAG: hypothetical protein EOO77_40875 [Oxalobacteraceae bacterium]|nr:MAG: hypothetical protein EOO77_40875 [Oxalobacteraceae bacterium]